MKIKLHHMLITLGLAIAAPNGFKATYGQDVGAPSFEAYDPESDRERERVIHSPGENADPPHATSKTQPNAVSSKDSISRIPVQPFVKPPTEGPKNPGKSKNEDDSILSFNFLYYIIQKYKLQDIVD